MNSDTNNREALRELVDDLKSFSDKPQYFRGLDLCIDLAIEKLERLDALETIGEDLEVHAKRRGTGAGLDPRSYQGWQGWTRRVWWVGSKIYTCCSTCGQVVRVNKPLLGSCHFCAPPEERKVQ